MGGSGLALDNILSATFFFVGKWTPALKRNQSRDVLRHLLCRLYGASKGSLFHAQVRASHASLAASVGLSREWTCMLLGRLRDEGWVAYATIRLPDGRYEIGSFRPGRMLKRLLCVLLGHRRPRKSRVNDSSQSLPTKADIKKSYLLWQELKKVLAAKMGRK